MLEECLPNTTINLTTTTTPPRESEFQLKQDMGGPSQVLLVRGDAFLDLATVSVLDATGRNSMIANSVYQYPTRFLLQSR